MKENGKTVYKHGLILQLFKTVVMKNMTVPSWKEFTDGDGKVIMIEVCRTYRGKNV